MVHNVIFPLANRCTSEDAHLVAGRLSLINFEGGYRPRHQNGNAALSKLKTTPNFCYEVSECPSFLRRAFFISINRKMNLHVHKTISSASSSFITPPFSHPPRMRRKNWGKSVTDPTRSGSEVREK